MFDREARAVRVPGHSVPLALVACVLFENLNLEGTLGRRMPSREKPPCRRSAIWGSGESEGSPRGDRGWFSMSSGEDRPLAGSFRRKTTRLNIFSNC